MSTEEEKNEIGGEKTWISSKPPIFSGAEATEKVQRSARSRIKGSLTKTNMIESEPIQGREKATDRIVHIEDELTLDIPEVLRICDQMEGLERAYVQVDKDCKLYVEQEGNGEPIVLLHGGPGATHHYFHPHFSQLANSAKVISYDQRGCGLSDHTEGDGYSIDQAVDDLENLRKTLGIDRWTILGHSYGGLLAQCYAKKYPKSCKGLVLTCASTGLMNLEPGRGNAVLSKEESQKIELIHNNPNLTTQQKIYNAFLNGDWKRQDLYKPIKEEMVHSAVHEWDQDPDFRNKVGQEAMYYDLKGVFTDCPIPTLIIEGRKDMTWNTDKPKKLQQNHPNASMIMLEESAHNPFKDEPKRFFDELRGFLKGLPSEFPSDLQKWETHVSEWEDAKINSPDNLIMSLGKDKDYYKKIVNAYSPKWLEQLKYSSSFREVGFALYIAGRHEEALAYFQRMETLGAHPFEIATSLIWQGHMLDLLGRRNEAIDVYKKVETMGINDNITMDQFNLTFQPSPYASERLQEPFCRN